LGESITRQIARVWLLAAHGGVATRWNGTTIPPVWRRSRQPFKPTHGMPRKLAGFHPH